MELKDLLPPIIAILSVSAIYLMATAYSLNEYQKNKRELLLNIAITCILVAFTLIIIHSVIIDNNNNQENNEKINPNHSHSVSFITKSPLLSKSA